MTPVSSDQSIDAPAGNAVHASLRWVPASLRAHRNWPKIERWVVKLGAFFFAQGVLQGLMALSGFFLLRWMPVNEYAIYTLAFSIQSAMFTFGDVGFTNAIIPLVGQRVGDPAVIGTYMAAARRLRLILLPFVVVCAGAAFIALGRQQAIGGAMIAALFTLSVVGLWFNATTAISTTPLLVKQDLRFMHSMQNGVALTRFSGYAIGFFGSVIGSVFVFALNTALNIVQALWTARRSRPHVVEPSAGSTKEREARREMIRFIRPQVPILVFSAFQGQMMVFIISVAGSATGLADIGAVSRLNLLFAFAPFFCGWIVQPFFARIDAQHTGRRFAQILAWTAGGLAAIPAMAFLVPGPFVWLLGHHYAHLRLEAGLMLTASAIGTTTAVVVTMCFARGWFRDHAVLWSAAVTIAFQVFAATSYDLSQPSGPLFVMIWGNGGGLIAYTLLAFRGWVREQRDANTGKNPPLPDVR